MTANKLNRLAVAFGTLGVLSAILTATLTPALASASASTRTHSAAGRAPSVFTSKLRYIVGANVAVSPGTAKANVAKCPKGMFPVGGGPSSPSPVWTINWSNADRSSKSVAEPNEWDVALFNNGSSTEVFKVFVVCASAQKVSSNY